MTLGLDLALLDIGILVKRFDQIRLCASAGQKSILLRFVLKSHVTFDSVPASIVMVACAKSEAPSGLLLSCLDTS